MYRTKKNYELKNILGKFCVFYSLSFPLLEALFATMIGSHVLSSNLPLIRGHWLEGFSMTVAKWAVFEREGVHTLWSGLRFTLFPALLASITVFWLAVAKHQELSICCRWIWPAWGSYQATLFFKVLMGRGIKLIQWESVLQEYDHNLRT